MPTLLALSGRHGTFVDAAFRGFSMGPVQTEWHDQLEKERPETYKLGTHPESINPTLTDQNLLFCRVLINSLLGCIIIRTYNKSRVW